MIVEKSGGVWTVWFRVKSKWLVCVNKDKKLAIEDAINYFFCGVYAHASTTVL